MNQLVKLIHEQPNVENTIPHTLYQASSPKLNLAEEDKFIIYAGGGQIFLSTNTDLSDLNRCRYLYLTYKLYSLVQQKQRGYRDSLSRNNLPWFE